MSLTRSRPRTPTPSSRGWVPRGFPTVLGASRFNEVSVSSIEDAKRTVAFDGALALVGSVVSEMPVTFWDSPAGYPDRAPVKAPKWIFDPAGDGYGLPDWVFQAVASLVAKGNLFLRVLDTRGDVITQADVLHPDHVRPPIEALPLMSSLPAGAHWLVDGNPDPNVRHYRSEPIPGTLLGPSLIESHATSIRMPQVAALFGAHWFDDGGHPSSILLNEYMDAASLNDKQATALKERFMASTQGRREPIVLGRGWKYQPISVTAEESQFLQTLGYSQADVARMFGPGVCEILGYSSTGGGGGLTYANLESRAAHLLVFGIGKWISRMERILKAMCPRNVFPSFDRNSIVNATPAQLYKNVSVALACRAMVPNEARALMGYPPVEWGDEPNPIAGANTVSSDADNTGDENQDSGDGADDKSDEDKVDEEGSTGGAK